MKVVIDIDDNLYTRLFDNGVEYFGDAKGMAKAIRKGTPLPKGHGRIGDLDKLKERCLFMSNDDTAIEGMEYVTKGMIDNAEILIEADKEIDNG